MEKRSPILREIWDGVHDIFEPTGDDWRPNIPYVILRRGQPEFDRSGAVERLTRPIMSPIFYGEDGKGGVRGSDHPIEIVNPHGLRPSLFNIEESPERPPQITPTDPDIPGFSDSGATPTLSEDSQDVTMSKMITAQDEDAILEDAADLNLPKTEEQPDGQEQPEQDDEEDRLSDISGLSDLSGSDWKPMAGTEKK